MTNDNEIHSVDLEINDDETDVATVAAQLVDGLFVRYVGPSDNYAPTSWPLQRFVGNAADLIAVVDRLDALQNGGPSDERDDVVASIAPVDCDSCGRNVATTIVSQAGTSDGPLVGWLICYGCSDDYAKRYAAGRADRLADRDAVASDTGYVDGYDDAADDVNRLDGRRSVR